MTPGRPSAALHVAAAGVLLGVLLSGLGVCRAATSRITVSRSLHLNHPFGLAIDTHAVDHPEWIYVADSLNNRVLKVSPGGRVVARWGYFGSRLGAFEQPAAVAVGLHGNVYVIDYGNNRVEEFSSSGKPLTEWGSYGGAPGELAGPSALAVDALGRVYVADALNCRVQVFSSSGRFLAQWPIRSDDPRQMLTLGGIAVSDVPGHPFNVYVTEVGASVDPFGNLTAPAQAINRIQKLSPDGQILFAWVKPGASPTRLKDPRGLAIDPSGGLYVADSGNNRVLRFPLSNAGAETLVHLGPGVHLSEPSEVALDREGRIYVIDWGHSRILRLSSTGQLTSVWR